MIVAHGLDADAVAIGLETKHRVGANAPTLWAQSKPNASTRRIISICVLSSGTPICLT